MSVVVSELDVRADRSDWMSIEGFCTTHKPLMARQRGYD